MVAVLAAAVAEDNAPVAVLAVLVVLVVLVEECSDGVLPSSFTPGFISGGTPLVAAERCSSLLPTPPPVTVLRLNCADVGLRSRGVYGGECCGCFAAGALCEV